MPPPHIIFRGVFDPAQKKAREEEQKLYHKGVVVTFQENAWVDTATNIEGLDLQARGYIVPYLERRKALGLSYQGVWIEDGLTSYTTEACLKYWEKYLSLLHRVQTPPNYTFCLQPIDHHIGELYLYLCLNLCLNLDMRTLCSGP